MNISANRLDGVFKLAETEYLKAAADVISSGRYITGNRCEAFEKEFAGYNGVKHCVGVGSGYDSLLLAFRCAGIAAADEVIVQGNTYIAVFNALYALGAVPVIAEPDMNYLLTADSIKKCITKNTKAVVVTHLYGMMTPMDEIMRLCKECGLFVIEDSAQSHGAEYKGVKAGAFGDLGCFSFYPTKNLGGFGDGGAVITNNDLFADNLRKLRNQGHCGNDYVLPGVSSRLDEIQAALLSVKLKYLDLINAEKNAIAKRYNESIVNPLIAKPVNADGAFSIYHQYVIKCEQRDKLKNYLSDNGVETAIHFPVPAHLTAAFAYLGKEKGSFPVSEHLCNTVLSIPSYYGLSEKEQNYIISLLNSFE